MSESRVSRPEMIGIVVGFAAAATLTGAIMMLNVWPALTTPPLVLDSPAPAMARTAPKTAPQNFALSAPAPVRPAPKAPSPAIAPAPATAARPAPSLQLPLPQPTNIFAAAPPLIASPAPATRVPAPTHIPLAEASGGHAPSAAAAKTDEPAKNGTAANTQSDARQRQAATPSAASAKAATVETAKATQTPPQAANASAPQPDITSQTATSAATLATSPAQAQTAPVTSPPPEPQILLSDSPPAPANTNAASSATGAPQGAPAGAPQAQAQTGDAPAPTTSDSAEGTTQSIGATAVVINYAHDSKNAAASARALAAVLRKKGLAVETNTVDNAVGDNEVKFFHAHDKATATKLKSLANGVKDSKGRHRGYDVKDASAESAPPAPGHIEIWLKGG